MPQAGLQFRLSFYDLSKVITKTDCIAFQITLFLHLATASQNGATNDISLSRFFIIELTDLTFTKDCNLTLSPISL